jgi:hypothetical protein
VAGSTSSHDFPVTSGAFQTNPDGNFVTELALGSTTPILTTPTVSLKLSSSKITSAQAFTVTVAVSGPSGDPTPTGSVTLTSGSYSSGAETLSGGNATIDIPAGMLAVGTDTLTASYVPDSASSSTYDDASGTAAVTVTQATTRPPITVSLSSSSITTAQALKVTVTATGTPTPTGKVQLTGGGYDNTQTLSNGTTTFTIAAGSLNVGSDWFIAYYTPDANSSSIYEADTGQSSTVTVTQGTATPTVTVTPSFTSITPSQALTVTVGVSGGTANPTATGTVTLTSGSYTSAAATLSSGSATIDIPGGSLAVGNDTLTVTYTPDSASSSIYSSAVGTASVAVSATSGFTLSVLPATLSIAQGGNGTTTITPTDVGGFSGTISLAASGLPSGVTASFAAGSAAGTQVLTLAASSSATITSTPVTVTITGTSGTLSASTSVALTITAEPSFTAGSGGTTTLTVSPGAATGNTGTISVAGTNGFSGTVSLTCAVTTAMTGVNDMPTCSLSPTSVTLSGTTAQTSTLTVATTASSSAENHMKKLFWPSTGGTALALIFLFCAPRRRRNWPAMLGLLVLFVSFGAMGCGGGGGSGGGGGGGGGGGNSGTTTGSYSITVTGTSGLISATVGTVTLTVQ